MLRITRTLKNWFTDEKEFDQGANPINFSTKNLLVQFHDRHLKNIYQIQS